MNQKGFANIVLIILVVVLAGALGYVALVKKPISTEQLQVNNSQNTQTTIPPPVNNTVSQNQDLSETANWKIYRNSEYGFELKYPSKYSLASGWGWGSFDVHFINSSNAGVHVSGEGAGGNYCFLGFCNTPGKTQLTANGITWDYLGQQGYGDAGGSTAGRFIYRVTHDQYRFYVHFDKDESENKLVMKSFKFTKQNMPPSTNQTPPSTSSGDTFSTNLNGYFKTCMDTLAMYKRINGSWGKAPTELPGKGLYYLDNKFVGPGMCDVVVCTELPKPYTVQLVEYKKVGEKAPPLDSGITTTSNTLPVYQTVSLSGDVKIDIQYFTDKNCQSKEMFSTVLNR